MRRNIPLLSITIHSEQWIQLQACCLRNFVNKKVACARTKTEAIVIKVFYPWMIQELKIELFTTGFVSISFDTSNHKSIKLLPLIVWYYDPYDEHEPVKNKILYEIMEKFELLYKTVALSADHTNTFSFHISSLEVCTETKQWMSTQGWKYCSTVNS